MTPWRPIAITDPALELVATKLAEGRRLDRNDGLVLAATPDVVSVGALANIVRERLHGHRTYYVRNCHINYTNVCNKHCLFCQFARNPKDGGPDLYTLSIADVTAELERRSNASTREVHIVGGVNPRLPYSYYIELLQAVRHIRPQAVIKAFTAVELKQIADQAGKSISDVLGDLQSSGLGAIPGGGAEVLSDRIHQALYPRKLTPSEWLAVSRDIAGAGLTQYATMLYGHIETIEEQVDHLLKIRALQDETGHFVAFTPLAFHPEGTYMEDIAPPTGRQDLHIIALSRLLLDNIPHIKTFWIMNTPSVSQIALSYGADDLDGTVEEYQITYEEGRFGDRRQYLAAEDMQHIIREAGREPIERDGLYQPVAA